MNRFRNIVFALLLCVVVFAPPPAAVAGVAEPPDGKATTASSVPADDGSHDDTTSARIQADAINPDALNAFQPLQQLNELVDIGMPGLALRLITQQQANQPEFSPDWYAYEFKALRTLASMQRWQAVIDRVAPLLERAEPGRQITPRIRDWLRTQQAIAQLKLGQAQSALSQVRDMLWSGDEHDSELIALWRRLVIRAYLRLDLDDDAHKALRRYSQDYGELNDEWKLLQARTLLRTQRPSEAADLLANEASEAANALRLIATIRARPKKLDGIIGEIRKRLQQASLTPADKSAYGYALYEAAGVRQDTVMAIEALQQLLVLNRIDELGEEFSISADALWQQYESLGRQSGNRDRLLLGDDPAWFARAGELRAKKPAEAVGLYSVIAFNTADDQQRQLAHKEITAQLSATGDGLALINRLYLYSSRVGAAENLPTSVRYNLVDYALSAGDTALAARLMAGLPEPPAGADAFDWKVRKARVLVMEGQHEAGVAVLEQSLSELAPTDVTAITADVVADVKADEAAAVTTAPVPDAAKIDRYLQVVFDLQSIEQHAQALRLLELLPMQSMEPKLQRELYYWKAESAAALAQHDQAAWLYLKSALTTDPSMSDPWAQSARFKAAEELVEAGLYDDARLAYSELLAITASKSRKILIQQKLQQVRLLSNATTEDTR